MSSRREKAEKVFEWGKTQKIKDQDLNNWVKHSFGVAKVAEKIAKKAGLDPEKAYSCGLLHDIGRCFGLEKGMYHVISGYEILMEKGMPEEAKICLTHSFWPKKKLGEFGQIGNEEEWKKLNNFITQTEYDDYDKLVQLADYMSGSHGVTTVERRFCSVLIRHGLNDPRGDLRSLLELKYYFDGKTGMNIYRLFEDEIAATAIHSIIIRGKYNDKGEWVDEKKGDK